MKDNPLFNSMKISKKFIKDPSIEVLLAIHVLLVNLDL